MATARSGPSSQNEEPRADGVYPGLMNRTAEETRGFPYGSLWLYECGALSLWRSGARAKHHQEHHASCNQEGCSRPKAVPHAPPKRRASDVVRHF
jgi:hypothetical protein